MLCFYTFCFPHTPDTCEVTDLLDTLSLILDKVKLISCLIAKARALNDTPSRITVKKYTKILCEYITYIPTHYS